MAEGSSRGLATMRMPLPPLAGAGFAAHHLHGLRGGADEDDSGLAAGAGEGWVLGEKAVTGMDGLGTAAARGFENPGNVQIGLGCLGGAEILAETGLAYVESPPVHVGVDRDRLDAHLATGTDDAYRDLAAIGDEDSFEHVSEQPSYREGWIEDMHSIRNASGE